jgi:hypothetical protein
VHRWSQTAGEETIRATYEDEQGVDFLLIVLHHLYITILEFVECNMPRILLSRFGDHLGRLRHMLRHWLRYLAGNKGRRDVRGHGGAAGKFRFTGRNARRERQVPPNGRIASTSRPSKAYTGLND